MLVVAAVLPLTAVSTSAVSHKKQAPATYEQFRELLRDNCNVTFTCAEIAAGAALFQAGDQHIDEVIRALDDQDRSVRENAGYLIRYLANPAGLNVLRERYRKTGITEGPVPLPLTDFEYEEIGAKMFSRELWDATNESYLYALAGDGSQRAEIELKRIREVFANRKEKGPFHPDVEFGLERLADRKPATVMKPRKDLAGMVLKHAFFIPPRRKGIARAKLIAVSGDGTKALVNIGVVWGSLDGYWYNVVIRREADGWHFVSIYQAAVA